MSRGDLDCLLDALRTAAPPLLDAAGTSTVARTMHTVAGLAVRAVPGAAHAGIAVMARDRLVTCAATHLSVTYLDRVQDELGEGPTRTAATPGVVVPVAGDDLTDGPGPWPRFTRAAAEQGLGAVLALPLAPPDAAFGALTLYATRPGAFTELGRAIAESFALLSAVALCGVREAEHLQSAVESRDRIGQAKGVLMERYGVGPDQAFETLVGQSQRANVKLAEIAERLAADTSRRVGPAEPSEPSGPPS